MSRPPSRCRCRWNTDCPERGPTLYTVRYPSSMPRSRPIFASNQLTVAEDLGVFRRGFLQSDNVPFGNDEHMCRRLRVDVLEDVHLVVFVHLLRRDLPAMILQKRQSSMSKMLAYGSHVPPAKSWASDDLMVRLSYYADSHFNQRSSRASQTDSPSARTASG